MKEFSHRSKVPPVISNNKVVSPFVVNAARTRIQSHVFARTDDGMFQYTFAFIWLEFQEVMLVTVCVGVRTHCIVWVLDVCENGSSSSIL